MSDYIREKYIPEIVKIVVSKSKPSTDQEFVEFSQALYDQIKKKQLEIKQVVNN